MGIRKYNIYRTINGFHTLMARIEARNYTHAFRMAQQLYGKHAFVAVA